MQISITNWINSCVAVLRKLLLRRICSKCITGSRLWASRFLVFPVINLFSWLGRSNTVLRLIFIIRILLVARLKNLIWWMKLVNCHSIGSTSSLVFLLIQIRLVVLILILILLLVSRISRIFFLIILLSLFPNLIISRRSSTLWKSLCLILGS